MDQLFSTLDGEERAEYVPDMEEFNFEEVVDMCSKREVAVKFEI